MIWGNHMVWNLDFDISAWFVAFVLIMYYVSKRNLPILRNRAFLGVMISTLALATLDILASITASFPGDYPLYLNYALNVIYFCMVAACPYVFCLFVTLVIHRNRTWFFPIAVQALPFLFMFALSITAPWNGFIFTLDEAGEFLYGPGRILFFYEHLLYLLPCIPYIFIFGREKLLRNHRLALYIFLITSLIGTYAQMFWSPYHQVISLCNMISILVVFLTFQGPDYYRERRTGFFDARGLQLVITEQLQNENYLPFAGFVLENYRPLKNAYSEDVVTSLLRQLSGFLRSICKDEPTFYLRNGIFLMLLAPGKDSIAMRDRIEARLKKPFYYNQNEYILHPRFFYNPGLIHYKSYEETRSTVLVAIEQAMHTDNSGSLLINEEMYRTATRTFAVEHAMEYALRNQSLQIYYQPIHSTDDGRVISAEALARIQDEELGLLMPDEFIPLAERNGSIFRLGEQVFEKVCKFIQTHDMKELGLNYIEVNLSPLQIARSNTADRYLEILDRYAIDPSYINLEITETENAENEFTYENIRKLSARGIRFSLDDYGTGYSNLINTIVLPYSIIKIDKNIVQAYLSSDSHILQHLVHHFTVLGKEVVAEGVETQEMADILTDIGCQYLQGFLYSKPLPTEEFLDYLYEQKENS